ncbi:potassium transport protein Kup [compost metagenome]
MPHALLINLLHNQVLHQTVVLLTVVAEDEPRVPQERRFEVEAYGEGFYRVQLHFGFMGSRTCRRRWVCVTWTGWISARSAAPTSSAARQ